MNGSLDVISIGASSLGECRRLIEAYPYKPFSYYPQFSNEALSAYMLDDLAALVQRESTWCFIGTRDGRVGGLIVCGKRAWETQVLGMEAGFIGPVIVDETASHPDHLRHRLLDCALGQLSTQGLVHITARLDANELPLLHLLETSGFIMVDGILHYSLDLHHRERAAMAPAQQAKVQCRLHRESDIPGLRSIAARAYVHDRFHSDPLIPPAVADQAYAQWIENACHGLDDAVMVAISEGEPAGYMTLQLNQRTKRFLGATVGKIWLVATAERLRGHGVAQQLMWHALRWFSQHGADLVEVGTQFRNVPGLRFYSRCGFVPINPVFALRKVYTEP